jgi:copper(I)-binding protein
MSSSRSKLLVVGVILLAFSACSPETDPTLIIDNARIRTLIPGQDKTVGYFSAHNTTDLDITLVGAESDSARALEFHTTTTDEGMVRMRRLETVTIPAGAKIHFQPGGHHLMLFGVDSLSEQNEIRLLTDDGSSLQILFQQIPIGAYE